MDGPCSPSTSAARSWRPGVVDADGDGRSRSASRPTPPATPTATRCSAALARRWPPRSRAGDEVACGVGCGGPMTPRRRAVSPLNIPGWRDFPLRRPAGRARSALAVHVDNDAKALALGEGWRGRGASASATSSPWSCRPASAAASCSTAACSTAPHGNAGHIGHVIVEPDGRAVRVRGPGLPRGRGVGHRHRGPHRARRRPRRRAERASARRRAGRAGGRRRSPPCSTCGWPSSPARWPSASATTFFAAAQDELDRSRPARLRPRRRDPSRPASATTGPLVGAAAVALAGARAPASAVALSRRHYRRRRWIPPTRRGRGLPREGAGLPRRAPARRTGRASARSPASEADGVHRRVARDARTSTATSPRRGRRSTAAPG